MERRERILLVLRRSARLLGLVSGTLALGFGALYLVHLLALRARILGTVEALANGSYYHLVTEPARVRVGTDTQAAGVPGRLARAGLRRVRGLPDWGEYRVTEDAIAYRPRREDPISDLVVLNLVGPVVASIEVDGSSAPDAVLPAEHLTSFRSSLHERRTPVEYAEIPPRLVAAVLAAEDRRFFSHPGVDWRGVARAVMRNMRRGRVVEGGSTITQQTVKILLNRTRRELPAKVDEAMLALLVERRFSKLEILQVYLNNVYLGHEGPFDVYGIAEAARSLYGKALVDLSDAEMFKLAAAIRAPNAGSSERSRDRIAEYTRAIAAAVPEVRVPDAPESSQPGRSGAAYEDGAPLALAGAAATAERLDFDAVQLGYYLDLLEDEWAVMRDHYDIEAPATLVASLDPVLQARVSRSLERNLAAAAKRKRPKEAKGPLQGASVAVDPQTGAVRALVGGTNYATAPFNRATDMSRQVGSTFKPFVYLTAFADLDAEPRFTQSSWLTDEAREYQVGNQTWAPANYDKQFRGYVTLRQALEQSVNGATVDLGMQVGVERIAELAEAVGLAAKVTPNPSVILGAVETSPLRLAGAYCTFVNGGRSVAPYALREVLKDGRAYTAERPESRRVACSQGAYVVTDMLVGALKSGTGASAAALGFDHLAAGKTGTSDNARDTWFVGFTPETVMSVWVGYDDNTATGLSGASGALPVWANAMTGWLGQGWDVAFDVPSGIVFRSVDPVNGDMANSSCPGAEVAAYVEGSEPQYYCALHAPSFGDRLDHLFGPDEPPAPRGVEPPRVRRGWWSRLKNAVGV